MGYYTTEQLKPRVESLGLQRFNEIIHDFAEGGDWPGTTTITIPPNQEVEYVRNVVYSIIHEAGVKPYLVVKRVGDTLTIDLRLSRTKVGVTIGGKPAPSPEEIEPIGDEGMRDKLWEEGGE